MQFKLWLVGQAVKTLPSHGRISGSIPLRAALGNALIAMLSGCFFMFKKVVQKWSRLFLMARNA